ncbi:ester cyclase [Myxococcota bacterium]|nr:ester cyclase [Myxococcota bacterium]MBU1430233.1 ester cyclase [Myxococcota bacterium]MBU1898343.1 ester cyclase [Myxococcota bacterium]
MTSKHNNDTTIALGVSRAIMAGDWERVDALLDDDFVYVGDGAPAMNKAAYMGFMRGVLCAAMTDMDMQFLRVIAADGMVAVDYTNEMTHSGPFLGAPATGRRVKASGQFMREVRDGKVTAEWQTTNALGLLRQLGLISTP